ncbi:hypothetical protein [Streptomyces sp. JH34]|uniref:hypothetical protein n=1 Tax=unclassified Streptomyces TaxID=2593676 RepID=UPI0023F6DC74|nr:hypothetical protein [Streptomyces sp. JH34]MDF6019243.1 hypothetical protein [Streptomyces sp. JH34]
MGFWGCYLVGRSGEPLIGHPALRGVRERLTLREYRADGWQVWSHPTEPSPGSMTALAGAARAPVLLGFVMDGVCVAVEAAAPHSGSWYACLGRAAMAGHLGPEGLTPEDLFLSPEDAAARAVRWAAETGRGVLEGPLLELLRIERPESSGEELFFAFLDRLGIESLSD